MNDYDWTPEELEALYQGTSDAIDAELGKLPFRTAPTFDDLRAALNAGFRHVIGGMGQLLRKDRPPLADSEPPAARRSRAARRGASEPSAETADTNPDGA